MLGDDLTDAQIEVLGIGWILTEEGEVRGVPYLEAMNWKLSNQERCVVGKDEVEGRLISTVFLGWTAPLQYGPERPMLFETMVGRKLFKWSTLAEARAGHEGTVRNLREMLRKMAEEDEAERKDPL